MTSASPSSSAPLSLPTLSFSPTAFPTFFGAWSETASSPLPSFLSSLHTCAIPVPRSSGDSQPPFLDARACPRYRHRARRNLLPGRDPVVLFSSGSRQQLERSHRAQPHYLPLSLFRRPRPQLGMGILNSYHNFALPAATTALQNLAIIIFSTALVWHYFQRPAVSSRRRAGWRRTAIPDSRAAACSPWHAFRFRYLFRSSRR